MIPEATVPSRITPRPAPLGLAPALLRRSPLPRRHTRGDTTAGGMSCAGSPSFPEGHDEVFLVGTAISTFQNSGDVPEGNWCAAAPNESCLHPSRALSSSFPRVSREERVIYAAFARACRYRFQRMRHLFCLPTVMNNERAGRYAEPGPNFWERFEEDLELNRQLGSNCFRFSFEWSRIEPRHGEINEGARGSGQPVTPTCPPPTPPVPGAPGSTRRSPPHPLGRLSRREPLSSRKKRSRAHTRQHCPALALAPEPPSPASTPPDTTQRPSGPLSGCSSA